MRALVLGLSVSLAVAAQVCAQEDAAKADPAAEAKKLLSSLDDHDPELCQTYRFGRYWLGRKNVGWLTLIVTPAGAGAGYSVKGELELFSSMKSDKPTNQMQLQTELDVQLGVVASQSKLVRRDKEGAIVLEETDRYRKEGEGYVRTSESLGEEKTARGPINGPNHSTYIAKILLARKIDLTPGRVVKLQATQELDDGTYRLDPLTVRVMPKQTITFRGARVEASVVRFEQPKKEPLLMFLDATRRVLVMRADDVAEWVAGTPEEITEDLPADDARVAAAKDVVVRYLTITATKQGDLDQAFGLVDWASVFTSMAERDPAVAKMGEERFTQAFQKLIRVEKPSLKPEFARALGMLCKARRQGDDVVVELPGDSKTAYTVRLTDGAWKIIDLPF